MDTNYTTKSQEAISGAMQAAAAAGNPQIEPAHLLVELLAQPDGVAAGLLAAVCPDAAARQAVGASARRMLTRLPNSCSGAALAAALGSVIQENHAGLRLPVQKLWARFRETPVIQRGRPAHLPAMR